MLGAALFVWLVAAPLSAAPPGGSTPFKFGQVYADNRSAVVRVKARTDGPWVTGVMVGAGGEVVFSAPKGPAGGVTGLSSAGETLTGELLGYDRGLGIGVARFRGLSGKVVPLRVAEASSLSGDRWVVTIRFDQKGKLEPFAGVVAEIAGPKRLATAMVPGQPGSPILSDQGELLGLATDEGARQTKVLPIEAFVPFLKQVVLGQH
jgi:hypothetical protein